MSTKNNTHRILAKKIAAILFTDGTGGLADRLELKKKLPSHFRADQNGEVSLGGWCREAAIDQIEKVLKEQNCC